jgi:hypothetical protein
LSEWGFAKGAEPLLYLESPEGMPVQPTTNLTPAFALLASTVNDFHLCGRPCLGAALKPKLRSLGFDEKSVGFIKFGDFLRTAEKAGYVRLANTEGGDIAIFSASVQAPVMQAPLLAPLVQSSTPTPASLHSNVPLRIRPDLWNAFNSHSDQWSYDPAQDRAFNARAEGYGIQTTALVPIPSGRERLGAWMRAFADQQEPIPKTALMAGVDQGVDSYHFTTITHANGIQRAWRRFHIQQVLTAIETWANEHGLHPKNVATPFHAPVADRRTLAASPPPMPPPPATPPSIASSQLNTRLESLVDNLIHDLISLRGLLAVVGPKQP